MNYIRKRTRIVKIGKQKIGDNYPILVQSMCNTKTEELDNTVHQIKKLERAGCEIVRVAVHSEKAAQNLKEIKKEISVPLVADIQYNYEWAVLAAKNGVDKIRFNPGNIGSKDRIMAIVNACKERCIPIRIGINSGSLEPDLLAKFGGHGIPRVMLESATRHIEILEDLNFHDIVVSLKASNAQRTIEACRLFSQRYDYPQHLGVTEAGLLWTGSIKSSVGIGALLSEGIGDTIRVSLTDSPIREVEVAWEILKALNLRQRGPNLISCPTCGRTNVDLIKLTQKVQKLLKRIDKPITVAVMGCAVNGPGESKEADIGIAAGKQAGAIFVKGKVIKTVSEDKLFNIFKNELYRLLQSSRSG